MLPRGRRTARRTAAVVALCALTACGSTVPQQSLTGAAAGPLAGATDGLSTAAQPAPGAVDGSLAVGTDTAVGGSSTGQVPVPGEQTPTTTAAGTIAAGPAVAKPASSARGVTATEIRIGLEYVKGADEARKSMGFEGVSSGDQKRQLDILVQHINKTGGMAGRRVVPVFHAYEANSGNSSTENEQASCATFAEDNEVFAVISAINHTEVFLSCLTKVGVPYISAPGLTVNDDDVFRRYPLHLELNAVSLSKQGALLGKPLADTGYYDQGAKIGLLTFEQPNFVRAVDGHLKPALKAIGRSLTDEVRLAYPQSTSDQGAMAAAISNAVLRFRQNGVTHVLITDVSALVTVLFATSAASQGYYPRFGWLSPNGGQAAADLISDKRSLKGAVELGWYPAIDLNAANQDVIAPGAKRCADLFAAQGYTPSDRNEETVLQLQCEIFFFTREAATRSAELTGTGFVQALKAISTGVPPASTYEIDLGRAPAGAGAYRVLRWIDGCSCFRADRGLKPLH